MDSLPYLQYFDRHLIYPVLDFLQESGSYDAKVILQAKLDLLSETNMPGHCAELYKQIEGETASTAQFDARQQQVDEQLAKLEQDCRAVLDVLENPEVKNSLRQDKTQNLAFLRDNHGVTVDQIEALFRLGQFDYQRGNYAGAIDHLYHFRVLSTDSRLLAQATWGKLAAEILSQNWETALSELTKLREVVDADSSDARLQLQNRAWLLHWSLFLFFNNAAEGANSLQELLDLFLAPAYLNAIQTCAPHLLRYLTVAVISAAVERTGHYQRRIRDLVRIIEAQRDYSDCFTKFASVVFSSHDYSLAPKLFAEMKAEVAQDYFLHNAAEQTLRNAQLLTLASYLGLHQTASFATLLELAGIESNTAQSSVEDDAESTPITPLGALLEKIEHLDLDIDEDEVQVEVLRRKTSAADQRADVVAKTRMLIERSQYLHTVHQQQQARAAAKAMRAQ
ncbi:eukaryotic translation initiation factor 3 subunit E [Savitreella phatthalungensis]